MPFVGRLSLIRAHKGLSLHDLAERSGLDPAHLTELEEGKGIPSCATLDTLAKSLDVPVYQLFYTDGAPPHTPRLTPRKRLEDLLAGPCETKPQSGLIRKMKVLRNELSALLH